MSMFFLRATLDPEGDITRGFSGVYNSWVSDYEDIAEALEECYPDGDEGLLPPRQDPVTGDWCWDPESGLSAFAFHDESTFRQAMDRVTSYGRHIGEVGVFVSEDYELRSGADGEDLFRPGAFVGWLRLEASYEDFLRIRVANEPDDEMSFSP